MLDYSVIPQFRSETMFRRKTTPIKKNRRGKSSKNSRVLHLNVMSPRIAFFQSLKKLRNMGRTLVILGIVAVLIYFAYKAIYKHFNDNDEFAIQYIPVTDFEGNDTVVLSKNRVWAISEIDVKGTIFQVDLDDVKKRLLERPEVINVEVDRKLPDTIEIKIKERIPVAWLACRELDLAGRNPYRGILIDKFGVTFKSEKEFWEVAKNLPVIEVSATSENNFPLGKKMNHPDCERALQFVMSLDIIGSQDWGVERVVVENFYTLNVICTDEVTAKFSMYEHDYQLKKLLLVREHASNNGKKLSWIDLRPKTNNPGAYQDGIAIQSASRAAVTQPTHNLDPSTQSILDRDN